MTDGWYCLKPNRCGKKPGNFQYACCRGAVSRARPAPPTRAAEACDHITVRRLALRKLEYAAAARRMTPAALAAKIIETVATENLVNAVLDDAAPAQGDAA